MPKLYRPIAKNCLNIENDKKNMDIPTLKLMYKKIDKNGFDEYFFINIITGKTEKTVNMNK